MDTSPKKKWGVLIYSLLTRVPIGYEYKINKMTNGSNLIILLIHCPIITQGPDICSSGRWAWYLIWTWRVFFLEISRVHKQSPPYWLVLACYSWLIWSYLLPAILSSSPIVHSYQSHPIGIISYASSLHSYQNASYERTIQAHSILPLIAEPSYHLSLEQHFW